MSEGSYSDDHEEVDLPDFDQMAISSSIEPKSVEKKLSFKDSNAEGMKAIFDKEEFSDFKVVLIQTGKTLHLYKGILASRSEFFKALVDSPFFEKERATLEVDDESEEKALLPLLEYCYTGEFTCPDAEVLSYYFISDKYQVNSLKSKCSDYVVSNLKPENGLDSFVDYYNATVRNAGITDQLTEKILKRSILYTLRGFNNLLKSKEKRDILLSMDYEMLMRILKPSVEATEIKGINSDSSSMLRFIMDWVIQDLPNRTAHLKELYDMERLFEYGYVTMIGDEGGELMSLYGEPEFIYESSACDIVGTKIVKKSSSYSSVYVNTILGNTESSATIRWKVKILALNSWIGMGVAMRDVVEQKKLTFSPYDKHGCYMLSMNGYIWNQFMKGSTKYESVGCSCTVGDTVIVELNCGKKELVFYKNDSSNKLASFQHVKLPVYPSFMMCGTESLEFSWDNNADF